jgi:hypothetical protein
MSRLMHHASQVITDESAAGQKRRHYVDERGYVPLSATGAELLFEVFSQPTSAARLSSPAICRSTGGRAYSPPRGSPARCSIVLPITFHILEMNVDSFRLKHSKRRLGDNQPPR